MATMDTRVGTGTGRISEIRPHFVTEKPLMRRASGILIVASFPLLASCATGMPASRSIAESRATPPVAQSPLNPPVAQASTKPASDQLPAKSTLAERAAKYDMITQQEPPTSKPSSTAPAARDYQEGYPILVPAPKARADGSLQSFMAFDTGPYVADRSVHNLTWTNNSGRPLAIYKAFLWTGVDKGAIADVQVEARRASDNSYIGFLQWDHYADPTSPQHAQQFDYTSPMILDPGEKIILRHFANGYSSPSLRAHHVLILWVK
jgi:hypothetical protein